MRGTTGPHKASAQPPTGPFCRMPGRGSDSQVEGLDPEVQAALRGEQHACVVGGWDVVNVEEIHMDGASWSKLAGRWAAY